MDASPAKPANADVSTLAKGGVLNLAATVIAAVLGFLLVVVVTRGLRAHRAGIFFEAVGLFTILASGVRLGADTGLVRATARSRALGAVADLRRLLSVALLPVMAAGALIAAATWAIAPWLAGVLLRDVDPAEAGGSIRLLALFLPFAAATIVMLSATRGLGTMLPYVIVQDLGQPVLRLALVGLVLVAGLGSLAVLWAWTIPLVLGFLAAAWALARLVPAAEREAPDHAPARPVRELAAEFWRFAGPRGLAGVFQVTVIWLNVLMVGALRSTSEAGIFGAVARMTLVGMFAIEAVRVAIAPQISGLLARDERERAGTLYQIGTWWVMASCWPLYVSLAVFGAVTLRIFGPEFEAGHTALLILSLAMLVNLGTGNVTVMLLMSGHSFWNLFNTVVALGVNVGLNLLLVPRMGITGAAIAWALSIVVDNLAALFEIWLLLGLHPFGAGWRLVALAAATCYGAVGLLAQWLLGATLTSLAVAGVVATALFVAVVWRARTTLRLAALGEAVRIRGWKAGGW